MHNLINVVIPMAGLGKRLRPHTLYRPKPLVSLAGKTILDFVLDEFAALVKANQVKFTYVIGDKGDLIKAYMERCYPNYQVEYYVQEQMRGQSDAVYVAKDAITGPTLIAFGDTITNPDLTPLVKNPDESNILWVKEVEDVQQLGVIEVNSDGRVARLHEKSKTFISNLALVGFYYFTHGEELIAAIEEQFRKEMKLGDEYYLADAINIMIDKGAAFRPDVVDLWLDAGKVDTLLATNTYLLSHGADNTADVIDKFPGVTIVPPVFIADGVHIQNSVIGPNAVIEPGCKLDHVEVRDSIVQEGTELSNMVVEQSIIGRNQTEQGNTSSLPESA